MLEQQPCRNFSCLQKDLLGDVLRLRTVAQQARRDKAKHVLTGAHEARELGLNRSDPERVLTRACHRLSTEHRDGRKVANSLLGLCSCGWLMGSPGIAFPRFNCLYERRHLH